ncbi:YdcF family protein [Nitrospinae bacterium AH_259_B05_G02_I21]|nr:YdcF family protein [Nitrospinae bacterium AH_259_B05_G02_I21]
MIVYYCIDSFEVSSPRAYRVKSHEERLLKKADLAFVTSHKLKEHCERHNSRVTFFPFGVSLGKFERVRGEATVEPVDMKAISRPRVGYVGGLHKWVDQELLATVARAYPDYSFIFVGPEQTAVDSLKALDNTHFLGPKPHDEVPVYVKYFDVALIPYRQTTYTDNVYPTKLNEYLAMGVPVVATPIPETAIFGEANPGCVYLAQNPEAFGKALETALSSRGGPSDAHRRAVAAQNSWEERIEAMSEMVDEAAAEATMSSQAGWQKRFTTIVRRGRNRLMRVALILAFLWFTLFYTSTLWWAAAPLKLAQPPEKADAIVVLGGGVGETGSFGDSTFERTRHGVELFKAGYAPYIIFSTGYVYGYKEAEDMKLLATSLGVPSKAILLEDRSVNTYDKARFVVPILKARGWEKILLVSAPYHMLRSALTFHGYESELELVYTPVPDPTFYRHERGAKLKHVRAIAHEYAGILYYWFKGYL